MDESSTGLPIEWVGALFSRFQAVYGNRATTMWGDQNPLEVQQVWAGELRHFTPYDFRMALESMRFTYKDFPPSLYQFADLCREAQRSRAQKARRVEPPAPALVDSVVLGEIRKLAEGMLHRKRDTREWARRILKRQADGEHMPMIAVDAAQAALRMAPPEAATR